VNGDSDFDDDVFEGVPVAIISSNTHSVVNCVSPFLHSHREEILEWGRENVSEIYNASWQNPSDKLYAIAQHFFRDHPERKEERNQMNMKHGIFTLKETELTGIQVDLIDCSRLDPEHIDPFFKLPPNNKKHRRLIVNIDYAFGKQAEDILGNLLLLFGPSVRSVNACGKAGALQGNRGDLVINDFFVMHPNDLIAWVGNEGITKASLEQLAPGRNVWQGGGVTVPGTLMQDRPLLHFYKRLYGCVSLEMEGSYYLRQVQRYVSLHHLKPDVATRFLYYVSDVPLQVESNLGVNLKYDEGIPPLYAITRALLEQALKVDEKDK